VNSGQITVNISGTFSEKQRPNNGVEKVAYFLNTHRLERIPVVGYVEWHSHGETRTGEKMAVVLPAIEPGVSPIGTDLPGLPVEDGFPTTASGQIMWLLDSIRRTQGKGAVADTLFSVPAEDIHGDEDTEMEGQLPLVPEVRVGADGEHVVPPASGEEIMAERAERAAAEPADVPEDDSPRVPAATFSAPGGDPA
jgi:hypothetical protein